MGIFLLTTGTLVAGLLFWWIFRPAMRTRPSFSSEEAPFPQIAPTSVDPAHETLARIIHHLYSGKRPAAHLDRDATHEPLSTTAHTAIQHLAQHFQRLSGLQTSLAPFHDPNVRMQDIAAMVAHDPALSARVLHTANSPLFRTISTIKSVHTAVTILGLANIKNLVAYGLLPQDLYRSEHHQRLFQSVWKHMATTAAITAAIAKALPRLDGGMLSTAALMHDIGKLLLIPLCQAKTAPDYPRTPSEEAQIFATTHIHAAKILNENIQLDSDLINLILFHHHPGWAHASEFKWKEELIQCLSIIFAANQMAHCIQRNGTWNYTAEKLETFHDSCHTVLPQEQLSRIVLEPTFQRHVTSHIQAMLAGLY
jgi:HD-like signal output (HDOD) protein